MLNIILGIFFLIQAVKKLKEVEQIVVSENNVFMSSYLAFHRLTSDIIQTKDSDKNKLR